MEQTVCPMSNGGGGGERSEALPPADHSASLSSPFDVSDWDADIDDDIEDGYEEEQTDDDDLPHISVSSLIPPQQMTECGPLPDWKMNLLAASLRCRRLWIAAGSRSTDTGRSLVLLGEAL